MCHAAGVMPTFKVYTQKGLYALIRSHRITYRSGCVYHTELPIDQVVFITLPWKEVRHCKFYLLCFFFYMYRIPRAVDTEMGVRLLLVELLNKRLQS